jgi:hypothetical protein
VPPAGRISVKFYVGDSNEILFKNVDFIESWQQNNAICMNIFVILLSATGARCWWRSG